MIGEETLKKPGLLPETLWDIEHYKEAGLYFYLEATQDILPNGRVNVENHGEMIMLGSYSYLGLIGHPQINAAAKAAVDHYGTGTHGVRLLAGSLALHNELETRIANFKQTEAAITFSSGYVTNLATISSLLRKGDTVTAKNYLNDEEIQELNRVVTMYLDFAEDMARRRKQMTMNEWAGKLDEFLKFNERQVLSGAGKVSHDRARKIAHQEYETFDANRKEAEKAEADAEYIEDLRAIEREALAIQKSKGKTDDAA